MKKNTRFALAAFIILSLLLAACSNSGGKSGSDEQPPESGKGNGNASEQTGEKQPAKHTFTMLTETHPSWPFNKDWPIWSMIEGFTGATFDIQLPSGNLEDTLNLTISSGNMPDLMYMGNRVMANKYGQQGALANILDYVDVMPNFKKWMEQYPEITRAQLAADGKMYMFPNEGFGETNRMIWMYREDIFKKHGLEVPATYDDLYQVLKQLKELYPKSSPFSFRFGPNLEILRNLAAQYGTNQGYYMDGDMVKYGPTEESFRKLTEYLSLFYKDGLMPPDWLTVDTKKWQDLMSTDQSFITLDYIGRIDFFNSAMRKDNPDYTIAFMAPPIGMPGVKSQNEYTHVVDSGLTASANSKQLTEVMKMMDFFYSEEGRNMASWGEEGVTYTMQDGKKKFNSSFTELSELRKQTGLATNGTYTWIDYDAHLSLASEELQKTYELARQHDAVYRPKAELNEEELEINSTVGAAVEKYKNEQLTKFILGDKDLSQWDDYIDGLKKLGLQQILDIHQAAFERSAQVQLK
ncbi:extracellular solute-binding protein [Paenibacillus sp. GCM10027626]|uniref:extracellular solute-binding protein n=1 Tax=Paenibacillus sp. GCM10027626 TaxID=3273411 RepID=UPI003639118D